MKPQVAVTLLFVLFAALYLSVGAPMVEKLLKLTSANTQSSASFSAEISIEETEVNDSLKRSASHGYFAVSTSDGTQISAEEFTKTSDGINPCEPDQNSVCKHVLKDGERGKILSRIQAALESKGKEVVKCLARNAEESSSSAIMLLFEAEFKGLSSGTKYKAIGFIHNLDQPERSTFMSLKKLEDGKLQRFSEIPTSDLRCQAALAFRDIMIDILQAYQ